MAKRSFNEFFDAHHTFVMFSEKALRWNIDKAFSRMPFHLLQNANNFWQLNKNKTSRDTAMPLTHPRWKLFNRFFVYENCGIFNLRTKRAHFDGTTEKERGRARENERESKFLSIAMANGRLLHVINSNGADCRRFFNEGKFA